MATGGGPRLVEQVGAKPATCRCGQKLEAGSRLLIVVDVPSTLAEIVGTRTFCSAGCVRAFYLESLETFDAMEAARASRVVSDLPNVREEFVRSLSRIVAAAG